MTETIRYCTFGCTTHRHLPDCQDQHCRGCEPRLAERGQVCESCHNRLTSRLRTSEGSVLWVWDWLTSNLTHYGTQAPHGDLVHGGQSGPSTPMALPVYAARQAIGDALEGFYEVARVKLNDEQPADIPLVGDIGRLVQWVAGMLWVIESNPDLVRHLWDELDRVLSDAHLVRPWRRTVSRCIGVACPDCDHKNLIILGGEDLVRCQSCRSAFTREAYDRWTAVLKYEVTGEMSA